MWPIELQHGEYKAKMINFGTWTRAANDVADELAHPFPQRTPKKDGATSVCLSPKERVGQPAAETLHARSLAPLVKTRGFGMTSLG